MSFRNDNEDAFVPSEKDKIAAAKKIEFTRKEIESVLDSWQSEEKLYLPELVINSIFKNGEKGVSNEIEKEFLKVCIVNQIYGSNLYSEDILYIAKYLSEKASILNDELRSGNAKIIADITCAIKKSRGKYCYSFATKYCSFAAPDEVADRFPIFDSYMSALYKTRTDRWNPNNEKGFYKYYFNSWEGNSEHDAKRYEMYRKAVLMMQSELSAVKKLTVKQLDQYLWKAMKVYSVKLA